MLQNKLNFNILCIFYLEQETHFRFVISCGTMQTLDIKSQTLNHFLTLDKTQDCMKVSSTPFKATAQHGYLRGSYIFHSFNSGLCTFFKNNSPAQEFITKGIMKLIDTRNQLAGRGSSLVILSFSIDI